MSDTPEKIEMSHEEAMEYMSLFFVQLQMQTKAIDHEPSDEELRAAFRKAELMTELIWASPMLRVVRRILAKAATEAGSEIAKDLLSRLATHGGKQ